MKKKTQDIIFVILLLGTLAMAVFGWDPEEHKGMVVIGIVGVLGFAGLIWWKAGQNDDNKKANDKV